MGLALAAAAAEAGVRLTLLDTCYLESAPGKALQGVQRRFGDTAAEHWAARVDDLARACAASPGVLVGAAVHSVRAVPPPSIRTVAKWAQSASAPLHAHLSEQVAENEACRAAYGISPTCVLDEEGALGPGTTVVHATHLDAADIRALGSSGTGVCYCPTTERDLADGIGRAADQAIAGSPLSLGTDSHAVVDLFEEARALELDERLRTRTRGHFGASELLRMASANGHRALGWAAGRIAVGQRADMVTVRLTSPRTSGGGATPETVVYAASAADVEHVVADGRVVVREGQHVRVPDVGAELSAAIKAVLA
jgi:formiminoglutamate deiminase